MKRAMRLFAGVMLLLVLLAGCSNSGETVESGTMPSDQLPSDETSSQPDRETDAPDVPLITGAVNEGDAADIGADAKRDEKAIEITNTIITKGGSADLISNIKDTTILASDTEKGIYLTVTVIDWAGDPMEMYVVFRAEDFHYDIDNVLRATIKSYDTMILPTGSNIYDSSFLLANDWDSFTEDCKRDVAYPFSATSTNGIISSETKKHTLQGNFGVCGSEEYCFFLVNPYTFVDDSSGMQVTIESVSFYPESWDVYSYEEYKIQSLGEAQAQGYLITGVLTNYRGAGSYYWEDISILPSDAGIDSQAAKLCPQCGGTLDWIGGAWVCDSCSAAY